MLKYIIMKSTIQHHSLELFALMMGMSNDDGEWCFYL